MGVPPGLPQDQLAADALHSCGLRALLLMLLPHHYCAYYNMPQQPSGPRLGRPGRVAHALGGLLFAVHQAR